ncbi:MAG: hypothetical protein KGL54_02645 [Sphingomonadales bacterium]|nr:hypothetical protein [Sphingomonadales bacterium]
MIKGLYRTHDRLLGACVRVGWSAGDAAPMLKREIYEALEGAPAYDELPSREDYCDRGNPIEADPLEQA